MKKIILIGFIVFVYTINLFSQTNINDEILQGDNWKMSLKSPQGWVIDLNNLPANKIARFYEQDINTSRKNEMNIDIISTYVLNAPDDNIESLNEYYLIQFVNNTMKMMVDDGYCTA